MKKWIAFVVIALSFAVIAQPEKGKGNSGNNGKKELKIKGVDKSRDVRIKGKSGNLKVDVRQNRNNGNNGHSFKTKGNHFYHSKNVNKNYAKHSPKFNYKKGHPNSIYLYSFSPFSYPTKNYGQWRSEQARNKHKKYKPNKEKDATEAIVLIRSRNAFLLIEIDDKLARLRSSLRERHDAGLITDVQFSIHIATIQTLSLKRNNYKY